MSDSKREALEAVAGAVSRETFDRLLAFEATFRKWSGTMNLAAPSTLENLWTRHVLDSAQLLPLAPEAREWVDLGSGGGFPGAIVAILLHHRADRRVRLVESNHKKCAFLRSALAELAPRAETFPIRIERAVSAWPAPEIVTARALTSLSALIDLSAPWLAAGSRGLFHKGEEYRGEIKLANDTWNLDLIEHPSAVDSRSVILEVVGIERKPL